MNTNYEDRVIWMKEDANLLEEGNGECDIAEALDVLNYLLVEERNQSSCFLYALKFDTVLKKWEEYYGCKEEAKEGVKFALDRLKKAGLIQVHCFFNNPFHGIITILCGIYYKKAFA